MEAAILMGLVGLGHLVNTTNENKEPINTNVNKDIIVPNGNNVYDSSFYEDVDNHVRSLAEGRFQESQKEDSSVINHQNINRMGSKDLEETNLSKIKEDLNQMTYSTAAGGFINKEDFMMNDQGITMEPFFSHAPASLNLDDSRKLNVHQGNDGFHKQKKEVPNFFKLEKENIHGNHFGEYIGDKSRYVESTLKTNELPFEQVQVAPIDEKADLNNEIKDMISQKYNIDNLRSEADQKVTYGGRTVSGKSQKEERGLEGIVYQHHPDKFYKNTPDKWFVTNGAYLEKSERPEELVKDTFRAKFNNQPLGAAAPAIKEGHQQRSNYRKPLKVQLGSDTVRNAGIQVEGSGLELQKQGYRALPNEREVTELRTYDSNLKGNSHQTLGLQDKLKGTIKETTINTKNNGNIGNTVIHSTDRLNDDVRITKKQTTIHSKNNGNIHGGYHKSELGYESPELTVKDTTLFEHTGIAGGAVLGDMSKNNYMNAETNPNKEIISQGRAPTLNNTKVVNGAEHTNMDIKKLDTDYINHRENGLTKVYQEIPEDQTCELTTMSDKPDYNISERIDPNLLNPFKKNPYTQSLSSFSY